MFVLGCEGNSIDTFWRPHSFIWQLKKNFSHQLATPLKKLIPDPDQFEFPLTWGLAVFMVVFGSESDLHLYIFWLFVCFFFAFTLTHLLGQFYYGVTISVIARNFAVHFSLIFLRIFVYILKSIEPNTLIWVSLKRPSPPTELEYRWWQFWSKVMTSEVEQRPMLVTSTYGWHRGQWVNDYWFKGNSESFFPPRISMFPPTSSWKTLRQNLLFPKGPVINWFVVIYQNKTKTNFEEQVEIPVTTSGHL